MKYSTGAIKSEKDKRDIKLDNVVSVSDLPKNFITDISMIPVLNQNQIGACVGHAFATTLSYLNYKETGSYEYLSPRYIYALSKKIDGLNGEGTYPRVAVKIANDNGCALDQDVPNNTELSHAEYIDIKVSTIATKKALSYKTGGYAFPTISEQGLKEAIVACGVVNIALRCGKITSKTIKAGNDNGGHYITLYGYKTKSNDTEFLYRNSWGDKWGTKGNGSFKWSEFTSTNLYDAITIMDIPNKTIEEARAGWKYFKASEKTGSYGTIGDLNKDLVDMLDKARDIAGIPFKINSGLRTAELNAKVGGVKDSAHLKGYAVDINAPTGEIKFKIVQACLLAGFKRVGISWKDNFVHVDVDPTKPCTIYTY